MPTRNIIKQYAEGNYYHAYNRGVNRMNIFRDEQDYAYMLSLLKRHLSPKPASDKRGRSIPHYADEVDLVAYCLMPNHYHLLLYLKEEKGIEHLMRSVMTSYSRYFNTKYGRLGPIFQNHFLASLVTNQVYWEHVSGYIHLNALDIGRDPLRYKYSSIDFFSGVRTAEWLHPEYIVETDSERRQYVDALKDYEDIHELRALLKHQLAAEEN